VPSHDPVGPETWVAARGVEARAACEGPFRGSFLRVSPRHSAHSAFLPRFCVSYRRASHDSGGVGVCSDETYSLEEGTEQRKEGTMQRTKPSSSLEDGTERRTKPSYSL